MVTMGAVCDVDKKSSKRRSFSSRTPSVHEFREMLDELGDKIDPSRSALPTTRMRWRLVSHEVKKQCYCQKQLKHTDLRGARHGEKWP
jgi:hypothetical protein